MGQQEGVFKRWAVESQTRTRQLAIRSGGLDGVQMMSRRQVGVGVSGEHPAIGVLSRAQLDGRKKSRRSGSSIAAEHLGAAAPRMALAPSGRGQLTLFELVMISSNLFVLVCGWNNRVEYCRAKCTRQYCPALVHAARPLARVAGPPVAARPRRTPAVAASGGREAAAARAGGGSIPLLLPMAATPPPRCSVRRLDGGPWYRWLAPHPTTPSALRGAAGAAAAPAAPPSRPLSGVAAWGTSQQPGWG